MSYKNTCINFICLYGRYINRVYYQQSAFVKFYLTRHFYHLESSKYPYMMCLTEKNSNTFLVTENTLLCI